MRKLILITALLIAAAACGQKQKSSSEYIYAASLHKNYSSYYYKGQRKMAEITFYKAVDAFQRMDSVCNISRLYITRYVLAEQDAAGEDLAKAAAYAETGGCGGEKALTGFLTGDNVTDSDSLEEPFSLIAEFEQTGKYSDVLSYAENKSTLSDSAVRLYRLVAAKITETEPEKAYELAEKARIIDSTYGWTLGLSRDLDIMIKAYGKLGRDASALIERKRLIDAKLTNN
ncbi:hypothetical protein EP073_08185 [Geovibrio thiophilus]|uniref:Tetratricopeptide repeat protein n=1 Tax=Geovibrio thiophilus TaxID=139438 RepID=A0A410JZC6_9BACT|nr:hypothetical protein [Geovibrio thiophilus]QAR33378.1 hypothetical protein EP073_08185 [Geovibrio thiophilus]